LGHWVFEDLEAGTGPLAYLNNHFGIKCHLNGMDQKHDDDEAQNVLKI
jgi:hypothetical protein